MKNFPRIRSVEDLRKRQSQLINQSEFESKSPKRIRGKDLKKRKLRREKSPGPVCGLCGICGIILFSYKMSREIKFHQECFFVLPTRRKRRLALRDSRSDSKNNEPWVLPLSGRLWKIIQARAKARRLDCSYVFHDNGKKIGDFRKAWQTASVAVGLGSFTKVEKPAERGIKKKRQRKKYAGLRVHDIRRCAASNLSRAGVPEQVAMRIRGHKTPSMYRRYRIVDETEIREALDKTQAHLLATANAAEA
jgi:integrase-like protein